jgi:hypothetical protein
MNLFIRIFQRPQFGFSCHSIQNSGQYSTQNDPCVLDGTPTRGLYLRRTIQQTECPLCIGWDSNARSLLTEDNIAHKRPLVYWMGLQREVSTYGGQYSTQNAPCVLGGTPTRGLYLRRTIQQTECPLCIGWDSNARSVLTEDNTAHKRPLVYWMGLQREVSTCRRKRNTKRHTASTVMKVSICYINNKK